MRPRPRRPGAPGFALGPQRRQPGTIHWLLWGVLGGTFLAIVLSYIAPAPVRRVTSALHDAEYSALHRAEDAFHQAEDVLHSAEAMLQHTKLGPSAARSAIDWQRAQQEEQQQQLASQRGSADAASAALHQPVTKEMRPRPRGTSEGWQSSSLKLIQCPVYSGPGWRKGKFALQKLEAAEESMYVMPQAEASSGSFSMTVTSTLKPLSLKSVRLLPGTPFARAESTNLAYLNMLNPDSMSYNFRVTAGLPAKGTPYDGWEHPGSELRGHFVGHYLGAAAAAVVATGDATLRRNLEQLLDALEECQRASKPPAEGYLSAFPEELIDRFEKQELVWAPYYTVHKIIQGLTDVYEHMGTKKALDMATALANYVERRTLRVIEQKGLDYWRECLNLEYGGMNDALRTVAALTGEKRHEAVAELFDKPCFLGPLAAGRDALDGIHANTHMPIAVGAAFRFAATGEEAFLAATSNFFDLLNSTRNYVTGGSNIAEIWSKARQVGHVLADQFHGGSETQESCTTHNMVKIARWLFRLQKGARHVEFLERSLLNGILGTQRGTQPGVMLYMYPMGSGVSKGRPSAWREHGWGTPLHDFWCCYGTLIESFARLAENNFFEEPRERKLYVTQFISSVATWDAAGGAKVTLEATPVNELPPAEPVRVTLAIEGGDAGEKEVAIRIPTWAQRGAVTATVNGQAVGDRPSPGAFLSLKRSWAGERLELTLPIPGVTCERVRDDRAPFKHLHALLYGPVVLAGLTGPDGERRLVGARGTAEGGVVRSVIPVPQSVRDQHWLSLRITTSSGLWAVSHGPEAPDALGFSSLPAEMPGPATNRRGGTDAHASSTWRIIRVPGSDDPATMAFESFDRPGTFLQASGVNGDIILTETGPLDVGWAIDVPSGLPDSAKFLKWGPMYLPPELEGTKGVSDYLTLESAAFPGHFLSSVMPKGNASGVPRLTVAKIPYGFGEEKDRFAQASTFNLGEPLATFPTMAFWGRGYNRRNFLLMPLQDIVDESYTVYFDFENE